jgi:hypothetical protein
MTTNPIDCTRCGQPHPRCSAHNQRGLPCMRHPRDGASVCHRHGGGAPQVVAAAERRRREREAILAVETFGLPRAVDPHEALLEELHRTAGAVQWLHAIVAGLERDDVVWGVTKQKVGGDDEGTTHEAKPNAWYALWISERKHLVDVAAACAKAGIEERRIQLAEAQGQVLAGVIRRILDRLGLSEPQRELVSVVVPEELRAVATAEGGAAA